MSSHTEEHISHYPTRKLFCLVADVEKYPEFLPWVAAARIQEKTADTMIADLVVRFKSFHESYTSRINFNPPTSEHGECSIEVTMVRGPFHHLVNRWHFVPLNNGTTQIKFFIDFSFRSKLLDKVIRMMFERALNSMVDAFEKRAAEMFGTPKSSLS